MTNENPKKQKFVYFYQQTEIPGVRGAFLHRTGAIPFIGNLGGMPTLRALGGTAETGFGRTAGSLWRT
ncbi:hypothetical protein [Roseibium sp.]|uniref:hypothetical protein n=1 Tax=Roseibium sp. TaxID=1936156 RepID=UPI003BAFE34A